MCPQASLAVWGRGPSATLVQMEHLVLLGLVGWVLALSSHISCILMQVLLLGEMGFGHLTSKGPKDSALSCRPGASLVISCCLDPRASLVVWVRWPAAT